MAALREQELHWRSPDVWHCWIFNAKWRKEAQIQTWKDPKLQGKPKPHTKWLHKYSPCKGTPVSRCFSFPLTPPSWTQRSISHKSYVINQKLQMARNCLSACLCLSPYIYPYPHIHTHTSDLTITWEGYIHIYIYPHSHLTFIAYFFPNFRSSINVT